MRFRVQHSTFYTPFFSKKLIPINGSQQSQAPEAKRKEKATDVKSTVRNAPLIRLTRVELREDGQGTRRVCNAKPSLLHHLPVLYTSEASMAGHVSACNPSRVHLPC